MLRRDPHRPSEADLAALADGSLAAGRRAQVEALVADSPELQALVDEQRAAVGRVRGAAVPAPGELRSRIGNAAPEPRTGRRRALAPALAVGVVVVVLAVVLTTVGSTSPTVAQAALVASRPATGAAPAGSAGAVLPVLRAAGLPYPYWQDRFGWRASGVRHDQVSGRPVTTVFYRRAGRRIAYTIVSGPRLAAAAGARVSVRDGTRISLVRADGRTVATWLRRAHTCVLSGVGVPGRVLVRLASWRAQDRIPY